jgi:phosphomannomutase
MWEESGGHTINILEIGQNEDNNTISPKYPAIGDKYPAEAILIISTLIEMGYDLSEFVDQQILGSRTMITGDDKRKMRIVQKFVDMKGQTFIVKDQEYKIGTFEEINGKIAIIHLWNDKSQIYFRPSGTGPGVRIYIFGPKNSTKSELEEIRIKIEQMFV